MIRCYSFNSKLIFIFRSSSISVVTSNKIAASSGYDNYKRLLELARKKNVKFLYETNVDAAAEVTASGVFADIMRIVNQ